MIAIPVGVFAGLLTTLTGLGGGMVLLLTLSVLWDPITALAVTAPALLVGNLHRLWMFRAHARLRVAGALIIGALPGSLLGGLLATRLPPWALFTVMAAMTGLVLLRAAGRFSWRPSEGALVPAGFGVGGQHRGVGGAGGDLLQSQRAGQQRRGSERLAEAGAGVFAAGQAVRDHRVDLQPTV
ncbi:MAG: TSUP family transporter, partial [Myxococcales bacterium]|nr:TSUP family transporter [Myxococcales bacterium]